MRKLRWLAVLGVSAVMGCTQSPNGTVNELVPTLPPTFGGQLTQSFRTPSSVYELVGDCDPKSLALQSSLDQNTWSEIPGGCDKGKFRMTLNVVRKLQVYFRARSKFKYTAVSTAIIRIALPPTTATLSFVSAGNADDDGQRGSQFGMDSVSKESLSNARLQVKTGIVDVIYEK